MMRSRRLYAVLVLAAGLFCRAYAAQPFDGNYAGSATGGGKCADGPVTMAVVESAVTMITPSGLKLTGVVAPDGALRMQETVSLSKGIILTVEGRFDAGGFTGTGTRIGCDFRYELKKQ